MEAVLTKPGWWWYVARNDGTVVLDNIVTTLARNVVALEHIFRQQRWQMRSAFDSP